MPTEGQELSEVGIGRYEHPHGGSSRFHNELVVRAEQPYVANMDCIVAVLGEQLRDRCSD